MKINKRSFIFGAVFGAVVALGLVSVARVFGIHLFVPGSASQQMYDKAKVVEKCIDSYYQGDIEDEKLIDGGVKGMVEALGDKYSQYYTKEEYKEIMSGINGSYVGIGVTLRMREEDQALVVQQVMEDGPAEKAGIKAEDRFVSVDGTNVAGKKLDEVIAMIKSEENKERTISIGIERTGAKGQIEQLEKKVVCEEVKVISVHSKKFDDVAYIQITEFDKETAGQFKVALENARNDSVKGLVIDVRENGGGSLDAAIQMLDELLPEGELISEKSKKDGNKVYHSTNEASYDKPVVVLINEHSASASEVFAGTLQARGAAKLVGTKSFGKGIVQTVLSLERSCGGGIKLTTAEYFLPGGISIHKKGLNPDINIEYKKPEGDYDPAMDEPLQMALKLIRNPSAE
ncbi:MAG: S41 family peptidase [Eubacterium sp.]|nr:S41 family peptidase [Eubacterium sp.]